MKRKGWTQSYFYCLSRLQPFTIMGTQPERASNASGPYRPSGHYSSSAHSQYDEINERGDLELLLWSLVCGIFGAGILHLAGKFFASLIPVIGSVGAASAFSIMALVSIMGILVYLRNVNAGKRNLWIKRRWDGLLDQ